MGIEGFAEKAAETLKKEKGSILKVADGTELIAPTYSDEHEHEGEGTHFDELRYEGEEGATEDQRQH
ncbi:hypothetical protein ACQKKK_11575 [Peribacillus sp. NPDC006672]|uniref:hypothetical protein n=1 Tax=Peribacillus sp. NPDC006672 TaxID=3390606 RepID=UPI003D029C93